MKSIVITKCNTAIKRQPFYFNIMSSLIINEYNNDKYDCVSDITDSLVNITCYNKNDINNNLLDIADSNLEFTCKFESIEFYVEFISMIKYYQRLSKLQKDIVRLVLIEYIELNKIQIVTNDNLENIDVKYDLLLLLVDNELTNVNRNYINKRSKYNKSGLTLDICRDLYLGVGLM